MKLRKLLSVGILLASALCAQGAPAPSRHLEGAQAASPSDMVELHVYLPLRNQTQLDNLLKQQHDPKSPQYKKWISPSDFLKRFGPASSDLSRVRSSLKSRGFIVTRSNAHSVHVKGSVSAVSNTFGASVYKRMDKGKMHFMAGNGLRLPQELAGVNMRVVGLETMTPRHVMSEKAALRVDNRYGAVGPLWFDDLKQAYDYPAYGQKSNHTGLDGTGVNVAILMSDLIFAPDVPAAFGHEKFTAITGKPAPSVTTVPIDGGGVVFGPGSFEASLDVQQVLGGAPGSNVTLVSIPDLSNAHVLDGYTYIVDSNQYDIVNSSFGGCEQEYLPAWNNGTDYTYILQQLHDVFAQGSAQGITFVASSGDQAGVMCPSPDYGNPGASPTFVRGVSTPADDPDVTAVGGGNLITNSSATTLDSSYVRESAYGDPRAPYDIYGLGQDVSGGYWGAGGGVSGVFKKPLYQALTKTGSSKWRTLPDVGMEVGGLGFSGDGCEALSCSTDDTSVLTAYGTGVGGGFYETIGTSVSSPEFVGALALFEQQIGGRNHRVGNVNYYLYAAGDLQTLFGGTHAPSALQYYHRGIPGFDGYYNGGFPSNNYDYIYGNGSPDVRKLFGLTGYKAAGLPQTSTNP